MIRTRLAALLLAMALGALPGCVRVIPAVVGVPRADEARVDKLALVIPLRTEGMLAYAATTWNEARLTVGRHDETMSPITYTFAAVRVGSSSAGLRGVGTFPVLPPGEGYWLQVELVQKRGDGIERIVGRGMRGDEDDAGIELLAGGNLAQVPIVPTVAGALLALSPVRPPDPPRSPSWDTRWEPSTTSITTDVTEVPADAELGTYRDVSGYDRTPRRTLELEAPEYFDLPDEPEADYDDDSDDSDSDDDDSSSSYDHDDAPAVMIGDPDTGFALQTRNLD